jgi:hypothetical protein
MRCTVAPGSNSPANISCTTAAAAASSCRQAGSRGGCSGSRRSPYGALSSRSTAGPRAGGCSARDASGRQSSRRAPAAHEATAPRIGSSHWSCGSGLRGGSRTSTGQPCDWRSSLSRIWCTQVRASQSGAVTTTGVTTTRSTAASAARSRSWTSPGRRRRIPLSPAARKMHGSSAPAPWPVMEARSRSSCCSLVCAWAGWLGETRAYRAVRRIRHLLQPWRQASPDSFLIGGCPHRGCPLQQVLSG